VFLVLAILVVVGGCARGIGIALHVAFNAGGSRGADATEEATAAIDNTGALDDPRLSDKDRELALGLAHRSLTTLGAGQARAWGNPFSGNGGTFMPTSYTVDETSGQVCRGYRMTVNVAGTLIEIHDVACRQDDGPWKLAAQGE